MNIAQTLKSVKEQVGISGISKSNAENTLVQISLYELQKYMLITNIAYAIYHNVKQDQQDDAEKQLVTLIETIQTLEDMADAETSSPKA